jgi:hypothetical protein
MTTPKPKAAQVKREKELRERIREIYRPIMNNDPPFKEEIDFGVQCYLAACAVAEELVHAIEQSISRSGDSFSAEPLRDALLKWRGE